MMRVPESFNPQHNIEGFDCGIASLNTWLERRALANQARGATRTFVVCDHNNVIAYYALASSAIAAAASPGHFRRNMPGPVPVVVLARMAVATTHHGQGLGRALFQDAALRVIHAADAIGIRSMIVHTLSKQTKGFYLRLGLDESPLDPMTLMVTISDLKAALG